MPKSLAALLAFAFVVPFSPAHAAPSPATTVAQYVRAWQEADPQARLKLLEQSVTDDVQYLDAYSRATNRQELAGVIAGLQAQYPGLRGEMVGYLRQAGNAALFEWKIVSAQGDPLFYGVDAISFASDGRLRRVEGFLNTGLR